MKLLVHPLLFSAAVALLAGVPADAQQEHIATLSLDSFSYINLDAEVVLPIPSGSQLQLRIGAFSSGGVASVTIDPAGVSIGEIGTAEGMLTYGLAQPAYGTAEYESDGTLKLSFSSQLSATISGPSGGSAVYPVTFSTAAVTAQSADSTTTLADYGEPAQSSSRYVRLVGARTNPTDALVVPGAAVIGVLSGTFDSLPPAP